MARLWTAVLLPAAALAVLGVDVSEPVATQDAQCLNQQGFEFAIVRCWCSFSGIDTNCASSVAASSFYC